MKTSTLRALLNFLRVLRRKVGMDDEMNRATHDLIVRLSQEINDRFEKEEGDE